MLEARLAAAQDDEDFAPRRLPAKARLFPGKPGNSQNLA
jgi:hypothetical protein